MPGSTFRRKVHKSARIPGLRRGLGDECLGDGDIKFLEEHAVTTRSSALIQRRRKKCRKSEAKTLTTIMSPIGM